MLFVQIKEDIYKNKVDPIQEEINLLELKGQVYNLIALVRSRIRIIDLNDPNIDLKTVQELKKYMVEYSFANKSVKDISADIEVFKSWLASLPSDSEKDEQLNKAVQLPYPHKM